MNDVTRSALWEAQFDSARDYPAAETRVKYVICTSPRCGSHYLGHLLHNAGGFGYPLEYLQAANLEVWKGRSQKAGVDDPLTFVKSVRTDGNGVFGIKLHYSHLPAFLEIEPEVATYRFITLVRRDLVKQAVSYAWASQTKSWISGMPELRAAVYNWQEISAKLDEITKGTAGWNAFLAKLGVEPFSLVYEDVRRNPTDAIQRVAAFLGVERSTGSASGPILTKEQSDPEKDVWVRRFVSEAHRKLRERTLLESVPRDRPTIFKSLKRRLREKR